MKAPVPTALGVKAILFYLLLLGAFFAAPYANLFYLLIAFLTVLGVMNLFWAWRNMTGVACEVEDPEPAPAGAGQEVRARVDGGRRPRMGVTLELLLADGGRVEVPSVPFRGETVLTGRATPRDRGVYAVRETRLTSTWPLGLLRARRAVEGPRELVVYPEPADLSEAAKGAGPGGEESGGWGGADGLLQPSGLRDYAAGDEIRQIHWKASARRGDLVVKEWEGGPGEGVEAVLDRRSDPEALEEALSLLAALAHAARDHKDLVTVHSQGISATFGSEHRPWRELFRFLAAADPLPPSGPAPPPASPGVLRLPVAGREP